jgi:hypothetical protein
MNIRVNSTSPAGSSPHSARRSIRPSSQLVWDHPAGPPTAPSQFALRAARLPDSFLQNFIPPGDYTITQLHIRHDAARHLSLTPARGRPALRDPLAFCIPRRP